MRKASSATQPGKHLMSATVCDQLDDVISGAPRYHITDMAGSMVHQKLWGPRCTLLRL